MVCRTSVCDIRGERGHWRAARQCVILEVRVVGGVQHMSACDIRGESGLWRAARQCVILEVRVVSGVQHVIVLY